MPFALEMPDEHVVERRRVVTLRRKEDVAAVGSVVQIAQLVEEQPAHDLERAEAGADVARPRTRDHVERVDARQRRERGGLLRRRERCGPQPGELVHRHELQFEGFTLVCL
jgi:hypothetical protein